MTLNKNLFFMAATTLAVFAFSPVAEAQVSIDAGDASDVSDLAEGGAFNAAAAVRVEYDAEGAVMSLSAASAFGETNAAAIATQFSAASVGSSEPSGYIYDAGFDEFSDADVAVYFGEDSYVEGYEDGGLDGYNAGYEDGLNAGLGGSLETTLAE